MNANMLYDVFFEISGSSRSFKKTSIVLREYIVIEKESTTSASTL
jgi:hypothetical protein